MENLETWLAQDNVKRIIILAFILLCVFTLLFFIKRTINKKITNTDHRYRTRKVANLLGYALFIASIMFVYNDKLGGVGVALGVVGAGVAFALQEVITSIAGWLSILMSDSVKVGNRLKIGDVKGDIIDIGILKTTLMEIGDWVDGDLYNGRIVTIANSFVFKESVHNYSGEFPFLWDEIKIPIRPESDFKLAGEVFEKVLMDVCGDFSKNSLETWKSMTKKFRVENANVNPRVTLSFDENWITFTLRYVVNYKERRGTKDKIFKKLLEEISKHPSIMIGTSTLEVTSIKH